MAKKETQPVILSSVDNYVIFDNTQYQNPPYVDFTIGTRAGAAPTVIITISDGTDEDIVLTGSGTASVTQSTFCTSGSGQMVMLSLFQCLRKNTSLFYDVLLYMGANGNVIRAGIERSKQYTITSSDTDIVSVSGTYSTWSPYDCEHQLYINSSDGAVVLEKKLNVQDISFNITSPFRHLSKTPLRINMIGMYNHGRYTETMPLNNNLVYILPATANRFYEFNYTDYYIESSGYDKKDFLTTNFSRKYNYNEAYCLSALINPSRSLNHIKLVKKYYTNSGMFLTSDEGQIYREKNSIRVDFYDVADLFSVEAEYNHQVGYFTVEAYDGDSAITNPVRFTVDAKCEDNDVIMFVNAIGGLDSFNFNSYKTHNTSVKERITYNKTLNDYYGDTKEYERVWGSQIDDTYTVGSRNLDSDTVNWLGEMQRSRYTFKFEYNNAPEYTIVIIDDMELTAGDSMSLSDVEMTYHYSDASSENII